MKGKKSEGKENGTKGRMDDEMVGILCSCHFSLRETLTTSQP